jgi:hypothetical protein
MASVLLVEKPEKTTDLSNVTEQLDHIKLFVHIRPYVINVIIFFFEYQPIICQSEHCIGSMQHSDWLFSSSTSTKLIFQSLITIRLGHGRESNSQL